VAGHAAVGVDDDLATGQTGVAHRAADHELAGRVDQQAVAARPGNAGLGESAQHRVDDVLLDVRRRAASREMSAACWVESTTVSSRTGLSPSYSMVTWVLPSGRR
jgi:hypothetical protein